MSACIEVKHIRFGIIVTFEITHILLQILVGHFKSGIGQPRSISKVIAPTCCKVVRTLHLSDDAPSCLEGPSKADPSSFLCNTCSVRMVR